MALITEAVLRQQYGDAENLSITCYEVPEGTVVTPSARAWLVDHRLDLMIGTKKIFATPHEAGDEWATTPPPAKPLPGSGPTIYNPPIPLPQQAPPPRPWDAPPPAQPVQPAPPAGPTASALPAFTKPDLFDVIDGSKVAVKPEYLTALRGNLLVPKNHPQIKFRGMLDALEADILVAQVAFSALGLQAGVADLAETLRYTRQVLRCEVLDVPFEETTLLGWDEAALRQHSHHPQEIFGITHFAASADDGQAVVLLNQLRTKARQVELAAQDAFDAGRMAPPTRLDLIMALNRLSSAFYLMMFKAKTKGYER